MNTFSMRYFPRSTNINYRKPLYSSLQIDLTGSHLISTHFPFHLSKPFPRIVYTSRKHHINNTRATAVLDIYTMLGFSAEEQWALALTTFAGLSTSIGAIIAIVRRPDDSLLAFLLGTAIGVMFVLSAAEMWIHNAMQHGWLEVTVIMLSGALFYKIVSPFIPEFDSLGTQPLPPASTIEEKSTVTSTEKRGNSGAKNSENAVTGAVTRGRAKALESNTKAVIITPTLDSGKVTNASKSSSTALQKDGGDASVLAQQRRSRDLLRLGFLMAITMTLHNAPEGFAVAFSSFTDFGPLMAAAIAIHNIPEGYIISLPIFLSTGSRWKAMAIATLSGLSEPAGALVALYLGRPLLTQDRIHLVLAFVGGIMAAVSILELWPEGKKCNSDTKLNLGIVMGGLVMGWTLWVGV